jgi:6-phosphofructokinase 1
MSKLTGALMFGQSGGPTSVINASACGVFEEAFKHACITNVYGLKHGIKGVLEEQFVDMDSISPEQIALLKNTPSSALGSVRYKLADISDDDTDYKRILEVFQKYNVRYFLYNGGNDSMDTCDKISRYLKSQNYECRVMGVPKTIDNDLFGTDHCPGYGSAAKYLATSCMEIHHDARVYDKGSVTVLEVMGRNAGWLTAATAVASYNGQGPDLIYLPEVPFDLSKFVADVKDIYKKQGNVIVAVSEGIHDKDGKYITEYAKVDLTRDAFNHAQLGGLASYLATVCKNETGAKTRGIEFSLLQRCAAHLASQTDVNEAYEAGATAVKSAVEGSSGFMVAFSRKAGVAHYHNETFLLPLTDVANKEKVVPAEYISKDGNFIEKPFLDYVLPLIQGEAHPPFENGVPVFANIRSVV